YDRAKAEVVVAFPSAGASRCNLALVYSVPHDSFGVRELPDIAHAAVGRVSDRVVSNTWASRSETWADALGLWSSSAVATATESLVFAHGDTLEEQDALDEQVVPASVGRHDLTFGEPERVKFVKRLHVRAQPGFGTLLVRVGARMTPSDDIAWSNEVPLDEPDQVVNAFAQ